LTKQLFRYSEYGTQYAPGLFGFGYVISAVDPRLLQLAAKFSF
jgi:hypothetical protein